VIAPLIEFPLRLDMPFGLIDERYWSHAKKQALINGNVQELKKISKKHFPPQTARRVACLKQAYRDEAESRDK
jgi:hypothetical protein